MKLYTNKELLDRAKENQYAVGAFNIYNLEVLQAIVSAGELEKSPAIVAVSEGAIQYAGLPHIVSMVRVAAQMASIPISLHLDHGKDLEIIRSCIESGFSSVMIDGSHLEFDGNVAVTKKVVDMARRKAVSVEAELGRLKGIEEKISVSNQEAFLTAPSPEAQFCQCPSGSYGYETRGIRSQKDLGLRPRGDPRDRPIQDEAFWKLRKSNLTLEV